MRAILLMDVGNTQTEIGIYHSNAKIDSWRFSSKLFSTEDEIASLIRNFLKFKNIEFSNIEDIGISSVVPEFSFVLNRFGQKYFGIDPLFVSSDLKLPIKLDYQNPEDVGADRICGAVAAFEKYKTASIVLDFGTATTFDVIDSDAVYLGGVITLGIEGMMSALHQKASKLPKVSYTVPDHYIGKTTEKSIQSGIFLGQIELVKGVLQKIMEEVNDANMQVVATGGVASLIKHYIPMIKNFEADLILEGLRIIHELNRNKLKK